MSEVKDFIEKNGHLPGIESAQEVEANGVDLGEMNKKLLEKVEELTLYLIKQDEEIKDLKEKLNSFLNNN